MPPSVYHPHTGWLAFWWTNLVKIFDTGSRPRPEEIRGNIYWFLKVKTLQSMQRSILLLNKEELWTLYWSWPGNKASGTIIWPWKYFQIPVPNTWTLMQGLELENSFSWLKTLRKQESDHLGRNFTNMYCGPPDVRSELNQPGIAEAAHHIRDCLGKWRKPMSNCVHPPFI